MTRTGVFSRIFLSAAACAALCGCFSSKAPAVRRTWAIDGSLPGFPARTAKARQICKSVKTGSVTVAAPFDAQDFTVRRKSGEWTRDPYNAFVSSPASLARASFETALAADGRFGKVCNRYSLAQCEAVAELHMTDLSLDATDEKPTVRVALSVAVLKCQGGRTGETIAEGKGSAAVEAGKDGYTAAWTEAFAQAVAAALAETGGKKK